MLGSAGLNHLIQQKKYMQMYKTLMATHLEGYSKRLKESVGKMKEELKAGKTSSTSSSEYANELNFSSLEKSISEITVR